MCKFSGCLLVLVSGPLVWRVPTQTCGLIVHLKFEHVCVPFHAQFLGPESVTLLHSYPQTILRAASDLVFQVLVFSTPALTVWGHIAPSVYSSLCPSLPSFPTSP